GRAFHRRGRAPARAGHRPCSGPGAPSQPGSSSLPWRPTMHARIGFASAALLLLLLACGDDDSSGPARIDEVRVTTVAGETDIEVQRGATVQLRARAFRGGAEVPDVQFQWRSEAPTIATVNANGLVQGVEVGQAEIVAEPLGVVGPAGRVSVSVVGLPVARIDITPETAWVDMGDTLTLRATARSANGTAIPDVELTWRSSSSILTVEPTGRVQGVSPGVAEVEAEAWNGVTGKARVHVTPVHASASTSADRKSTRLNSSHVKTSYAVFCLKKQTKKDG